MDVQNTAGIRAGATVRVSNPQRGAVTAAVEDVKTPAELPDLPELPAGLDAAAGAILIERGITTCVLLTYQAAGHLRKTEQVFLWAFEIGGRWFDLQRQELSIEVLA